MACVSDALVRDETRCSQGLLEILSSASEFDDLAIRPGEEEAVRKLLMHAPVAVDKPRYTDPHTKANALLQASRAQAETSSTCCAWIDPPARARGSISKAA